jgi:Leucine-rich repeat (LRR) protein
MWLRCCRLQDNKLQQLPDLSSHPHMTALLLDNNRLQCLLPHAHDAEWPDGSSSSSAAPHTSLQLLSVTNNQLTSLVDMPRQLQQQPQQQPQQPQQPMACVVAWLPVLTVLALSGNGLREVDALAGCSRLRHLDVSRNQLTSLQVGRVGVAEPVVCACVCAPWRQCSSHSRAGHLLLLCHLRRAWLAAMRCST